MFETSDDFKNRASQIEELIEKTYNQTPISEWTKHNAFVIQFRLSSQDDFTIFSEVKELAGKYFLECYWGHSEQHIYLDPKGK